MWALAHCRIAASSEPASSQARLKQVCFASRVVLSTLVQAKDLSLLRVWFDSLNDMFRECPDACRWLCVTMARSPDWLHRLLVACPHKSTRRAVAELLLLCVTTLRPVEASRCVAWLQCIISAVIVAVAAAVVLFPCFRLPVCLPAHAPRPCISACLPPSFASLPHFSLHVLELLCLTEFMTRVPSLRSRRVSCGSDTRREPRRCPTSSRFPVGGLMLPPLAPLPALVAQWEPALVSVPALVLAVAAVLMVLLLRRRCLSRCSCPQCPN